MNGASTWLVALVAVTAAGGLAWLQWLVLKRVVGRPNEWVTTSVVGAAVNAPLSTGLLLDLLLRAGLPAASAVPAGLALLGLQLLLGSVGVGMVVWTLGKK
jgi:hypothetical protein